MLHKSAFALLAASFVSASAFATSVRPTGVPSTRPEPKSLANLVTCKSEDSKFEVSYTATSFRGQPSFNVWGEDSQDLINQENQLVEIASVDTPYGKMITATVTPKFIADVPSQVYSILIPFINAAALEHNQNSVPFKSALLEGSVGGFRPNYILSQRLEKATNLDCTASKVYFW